MREGKTGNRMVAQGPWLDNAKTALLQSVTEKRTNNVDRRSRRHRMADPKIEKFKKVLQIDPNDETLWFGLGKAYMGDENWEEAISALESCLKVKPTYSAAVLALAQSLKRAGQPDQCRTVCAQGIDVATANGDLLVIKNLEELRDSLP